MCLPPSLAAIREIAHASFGQSGVHLFGFTELKSASAENWLAYECVEKNPNAVLRSGGAAEKC